MLLLFAVMALASALVAVYLFISKSGDSKQMSPEDRPVMDRSNSATDRIVADAVSRIIVGIPFGAPYPILLSVGAGANAATTAENLQGLLGKDARIIFSKVEIRADVAVPDISTHGSHVNTEIRTVVPPPLIVLRVSESDGLVYIAARDPGTDPLGPPDRGWLWVLSTQ